MAWRNQKFCLYGAGINAYGVIKFLGKERVLGVIDSARERWGSRIEGIEIHSMGWYLEQRWRDKVPVVISAFQKTHEVAALLESVGAVNYLDAPYMQAGMLSVRELADFLLSAQAAAGCGLVFDDTTLLSFLVAQDIAVRGNGSLVKGFLRARNTFVQESLGLPVVRAADCGRVLLVQTDSSSAEDGGGLSVPFVNLVSHIYFNQKFFNPKLERFRNIHKGGRCFIIGNGPSLRMEDLDALHERGEICFASNAIHLAFKSTDWRPAYYAAFDYLAYMNIFPSVREAVETTFFIEDYYNYGGRLPPPNVNVVHRVHSRRKVGFSPDVAQFAYSGCTVTYTLMQLAAYMGFSEIYLLGVDFTFGLKANHFAKEYDKLANVNSFQDGRCTVLAAYQVAEEFSRARGFRIYNATRGGALEVFERVDFDALMSERRGGVRKYSVIRNAPAARLFRREAA